MSPADIIARACAADPDACWHGSGGLGPSGGDFSCHVYMWQRELPRANAILAALTAAGYRITAPDGLDAKTIEACAKLADGEARTFDFEKAWREMRDYDAWVASARMNIAAAIRKLAEEGT